jgi:hypothetical protein
MPALNTALVLASFLPRVEDPWPDTMGLDFLFAAAGAGGVLASVFYAGGSRSDRDEAIRNGGLCGFWLGALFYGLSLLNQVTSPA